MIMKKTYINPETSIVLLTVQKMIAASTEGFNGNLDNENTIETTDMLSREKRRSVWDEEEEEENW